MQCGFWKENHIAYQTYTYEADTFVDGMETARHLGLDPNRMYKTLVTVGSSKNHFVFVIPVNRELDLKKAARSVGEKALSMVPVKDLFALTGYVRGGCTSIGMKKQFVTRIDEGVQQLDTVIVSGGKLGMQIELKPEELKLAARAEYADILA